MNKKNVVIAVLALVLLGLIAYNAVPWWIEQHAYSKVMQARKVEACEQYLAERPDGKHVTEVLCLKLWLQSDSLRSRLKSMNLGESSDLNALSMGQLDADKELGGKFIAFIRSGEDLAVEPRLTAMLVAHSQLATSADSVDYAILMYPYEKTEYYGDGYSYSSTTEMAHVFVVDCKSWQVVKVVDFDTDKNPFMISVSSRRSSAHYTQELTPEELYEGIIHVTAATESEFVE